MDDRIAEQLLYVDATLAEMNQVASRGRQAYDADIAVARACQYNILRTVLADEIEIARSQLNAPDHESRSS